MIYLFINNLLAKDLKLRMKKNLFIFAIFFFKNKYKIQKKTTRNKKIGIALIFEKSLLKVI